MTTTIQQLPIPPVDGFGAVADASGNLYVVTTSGGASGGGALLEFVDNAGQYSTSPTLLYSFNPITDGAPASRPFIDAAGNLIVATQSGTVYEFAPPYLAGQIPIVIGDIPAGATAEFATDALGNLFCLAVGSGGSDATMLEFVKSGASYSQPDSFPIDTPMALQAPATDSLGNMYMTSMSGEVLVFPKNGFSARTVASGYGDIRTGAAVDGQGYVFFANSDGQIYEFQPSAGTAVPLATIAPDLGAPVGDIVIDAAGNLFFATSSGNVLELAKSGAGYAASVAVVASTGLDVKSGVKLSAAGDLILTTVAAPAVIDVVSGAAFCFYPGTAIRTPRGEAGVETLKRGDLVLTAEGETRPVTWIGRQTVRARFATPARSFPVRVKAGALAESVPRRDLLVSPDHALLVEGVLIQAAALVNGTSVVRETRVPDVWTYYHVELDDHSLILAENAPAETFVDNVDRLAFDNWAEHEALYPQGKPMAEMPYPRAKARRQVPPRIRAALDRRAAGIGAADMPAGRSDESERAAA